MSNDFVTEAMVEAGAKALFGDGWETKATAGNKRYCREKARAVYLAMFCAPVGKPDYVEYPDRAIKTAERQK